LLLQLALLCKLLLCFKQGRKKEKAARLQARRKEKLLLLLCFKQGGKKGKAAAAAVLQARRKERWQTPRRQKKLG
jgi:hypothetical protein